MILLRKELEPIPRQSAGLERIGILGAMIFGLTSILPFLVYAQSSEALSQDLNKQLSAIESQITSYRKGIYQLQQKNLTLKEEIDLVEKNIEKNKLQIKASEIALLELKAQSDDLSAQVDALDKDINERKNVLGKSLQGVYELDRRSVVETFFSEYDFSEFFNQVQYVEGVHKGLQSALAAILEQKDTFDSKKEELDTKLAAQSRLLTLQALQQEELVHAQDQKQSFVKENKVAASLFNQKSKALELVREEIKKRLYVLKGLTKSVGLDEAFKEATAVSQKVGIDPVFLMAVLKVESDLGSNIGGGNWKRDMNPKEWDAFLAITKKLGLDPDKTPVSSAPRYGWGGAMGPAQFLPRTWLSHESDVTKITGHTPPSPWELEDAFAAAGSKLSGNGATGRNYESEWTAAMKYFAGGNWNNPAYSFYGDRVLDVKGIIASSYNSNG